MCRTRRRGAPKTLIEQAATDLVAAVGAVVHGLQMEEQSFPLVLAGGNLRPGLLNLSCAPTASSDCAPCPAVPAHRGIGGRCRAAGVETAQQRIRANNEYEHLTPSSQLPPTEQRNPLSTELDQLDTLDMLRLMNRQDAQVALVIAEVLPKLAQVVELITATLGSGGRLFYQGAGTSGRLAVLDAAELIPTFSAPPGLVIGLLAGGPEAMIHSIEGGEDHAEQGRLDLEAHQFSAQDMLIGIAASGRTPYVLGGLRYATEIGAPTAVIVCNPASEMAGVAQIAIEIVTGPEVLTGSTRA